MVNFIYQFDWAEGCPYSLILIMIVKVFLEETSV